MIIHGFQKMTLVDYPGLVASILFTGACNFRCPFCQNAALVLNPDKEPVIPEDEIFSYLEKRKGVLDGVVITGGEPTLQKDLLPFMGRLKGLGYKVKLDTNGYRPAVLKEAVLSGLCDYVAMDIKNSESRYCETAGASLDFSLIRESIDFLAEDRVPYEFRTTVMSELHDDEAFRDIARMIQHCHRYYLQPYSDSGDVIDPVFTTPSKEDLERWRSLLSETLERVETRDR